MDSFSHRWLESIGKEQYSTLFTKHGYSTIEKCGQLTDEVLRGMGVTNGRDRSNIRRWAEYLKGRSEADLSQELLVSVLHTELSSSRPIHLLTVL